MGEVAVGGCWVVFGPVVDFIDIFEMRGGWCWRSKLAAREHGAGIATGKHQPAGVNVKVAPRP